MKQVLKEFLSNVSKLVVCQMGTLALFVLRATLGGQVAPADRKLMKQFLELHKRTPLVPLYINTAVQPTAFLIEWLPENHMGLVPGGRERAAACDRERQDHLDRLEATLDRDVRQLITQTAAWIARIESCLPPRVSVPARGCTGGDLTDRQTGRDIKREHMGACAGGEGTRASARTPRLSIARFPCISLRMFICQCLIVYFVVSLSLFIRLTFSISLCLNYTCVAGTAASDHSCRVLL